MDPAIYFPYLISLGIIAIGYVAGRIIEARHYASIRRREAALKDVLLFNLRQPPPGQWAAGNLVAGNVVLSDDAFTVVWASLRSLFGGRIRPYEAILDRARREALLRMKAEAAALGALSVFNVRFEQTNISQNGAGGTVGAFEVVAYGTALVPLNGGLA